MHILSLLLLAGLLMGQILPDSVYIRLKKQGINPHASPPPPQGIHPLNLPESDCSGAIRLCSPTYTYPGGVPSPGQVLELGNDGRGTCLLGGEHRSVWFIFTVQTGGTMGFLICPLSGLGGRDYDFALWDVTNLPNPCDIFSGTGNVPPPIRCNYSANQSTTTCCGLPPNYCSTSGLTGLDHTNPQPGIISNTASDPPIMPGLQVSPGQTFLLLVDNFSNNNVGFTINFTGTAQYIDVTPPRIDSVYRGCGNSYDTQLPALTQLRVRFNELIRPNSVDANGSDFTLFDNTTNTQIPITAAAPLNPPQTNTVALTTGQPLVPGRIYALYINYNDPNIAGPPTGGANNVPIQDQCGNVLPTTTVPEGAAADTFLFTLLDTLQPQISLTSPRCVGTPTGTISAQTTGGLGPYEYVLMSGAVAVPPTSGWSSNSTWTNYSAGTYTVWIRDALGCIIRRVVQLQDPPPLRVLVIDSLLLSCGGQPSGFVTLQGQGGTPPYEYSLLPNAPVWTSNPTFTGLGVGTYTLRVRDANGCIATRSITVSPGTAVTIQPPQITQPILCYGGRGAFTVQATGGNSGSNFIYTLLPIGITNTTGIFTNLPAGTYTVRAEDTVGCFDTLRVVLSQPDSLRLVDSLISPATCRTAADGAIQVSISGGTPPYTYTWRDSTGAPLPLQSNSISGLRPGTYQLFVSDANQCTVGPFSWSVGYTYDASIQGVRAQLLGDCPLREAHIEVNAHGIPPLTYTWIWSDGEKTITTQPFTHRTFSETQHGNFSVRVEVSSGGQCTTSDSTSITVPLCFGLTIPDVITPNGDGINETWNIQALGFQRYTVSIYDRWGVEVWTNGGDKTKVWDGRNKRGEPVPEGTYTFLFVGIDAENREIKRTGTVTILR
ncbi:MAG: gliding motility-associated C-terminal domain-containing protein [Bacteroidia bacterium]|nr:gliding motility-associated C-terminal domain-containing protein [Bacteroidia bacterium]MDW8058208.1 gliding motility-associated C-terminal domain-containing protein [Bacteroidia bacterium]